MQQRTRAVSSVETSRVLVFVLVVGLALFSLPVFADLNTMWGLESLARAVWALAGAVLGAGIFVLVGLSRLAEAVASRGRAEPAKADSPRALES